MTILYSLLIILGLAYWLEKESKKFPFKINKQVFQEYQSLTNGNTLFYSFLKQSQLQYKEIKWIKLLYITFPLITFVLSEQHFIFTFILAILIYLSLLDYAYYLTDIKYIIAIFISGLIYIIFYQKYLTEQSLFSLFFSVVFCLAISKFGLFFYKKEMLGLGDSLLIIALSPLFTLHQLLQLLLYASLSGLLFVISYFVIKKKIIPRLPFIPFICLSTFILFIDRI
ncbi:prepilin peptidase [Phocoenobacter skyensis]|uniref:Leader peptidase HopD n=1 Tax=Phocoenobacter skyensis TaxID=97481 RepID=A0A1H7YHE6_9PAST|nr:prepilin peptidase [Pasteurella skyensis]MDP8079748.1 prepilin peptidase [Pasteurella skyensis]MDP8085677.1 prepilin peptidase [Pasteurella skyensis]MDP8170077.1 prepilin peptidase [Pasteurella skyensis]MDP8175677.1 prepilin peptidase [Pasteurella skyensis]MDP8185446.1 prepilin peptidase [Pasteurella skyensis]